METQNTTPSLMNSQNFTEISCSEDEPFLCFQGKIPTVVTLSIISIVTVCGNIFVMIAYTNDYRIRSTVANTFILNLSICDFIIGAVSIPLNSIWVVLGWWPFGKIPCQIWLILDYTCNNVTVLTIIFISLDRYWLLTKKLAYRTFQTQRQATVMCTIGWIVCTVFYCFVTFAWGPLFGVQNVDYSEDCELESFMNGPFVAFQLAVQFLIPLVIIIYLNAKVYMNIKQRSMGKFQSAQVSSKISLGTSRDAGLNKETLSFRRDTEAEKEQTTIICKQNHGVGKHQDTGGPQLGIQESHRNAGYDTQLDDIAIIYNPNQQLPPTRLDPEIQREQVIEVADGRNGDNQEIQDKKDINASAHKIRRASELQRHRKAAVTLSVIVGAFVATWLPFHVSSILVACCEDCISDLTWEIVNYLLWCNSTLNPFLYALLVVRFRQNFSRYLGLHLCKRR